MRTIQVCDEGDMIPDMAKRIVDALETKFDLYSVSRQDIREMVDVVRKEMVDFLFGE